MEPAAAEDTADCPEGSEEQRTFAQINDELAKVCTQALDLSKSIQQSKSDLHALGQLKNLEEEAELNPTPCPQTAQELQSLEQTCRKEKAKLETMEQTVMDFLSSMVVEAKSMSLSGAEKCRTTARSECCAHILSASEKVTNFWNEIEEEDEDKQQRLFHEQVQNRFIATKRAVTACLEKSSWPMHLGRIYSKKKEAEEAKMCGEMGLWMAERCDAAMKQLAAHRRDLDEKQRECCQKVVPSSREKVRKSGERMCAALEELASAAQEYLSDCIVHEHACVIESNIAEAKDAAEMMQSRADEARPQSHASCTSLVDQAAQSFEKVHYKVKEAALELQAVAQVPAEMSVGNTEMCRQLAEKLLEEKEIQLKLKCKELSEARKEKADLESECSAVGISSKWQGALVKARNKEKRLQEEESSLANQVQEAKDLCDHASKQLKDLLQLEDADVPEMNVKYVFNMEEIKQKAEEEVTRTWKETAFTMETEDAANCESSQVLSKRGKDPYDEIQKLQKELAKMEAYRKYDQDKFRAADQENKQMIEELKSELRAVRDDQRSVCSVESFQLVEDPDAHPGSRPRVA